MIRFIIAVMICMSPVAYAGLFGPSNFWECILSKLPDAKNDLVAHNLVAECRKTFPDSSNIAEKDKVGGLFSVPTAKDCFVKNGKSTPSEAAARYVFMACHQVYFAQ
jgi:hypothetical protein